MVDPTLVREELRRIVESRHFRASKRCKQFLQYVVEQKLSGNEEFVKERLIGTEVFGRDPDYATGEDPVVRVQAGEVRRRLELYQADSQNTGPVVIELPVGSYVPVFRLREAPFNLSRTETETSREQIVSPDDHDFSPVINRQLPVEKGFLPSSSTYEKETSSFQQEFSSVAKEQQTGISTEVAHGSFNSLPLPTILTPNTKNPSIKARIVGLRLSTLLILGMVLIAVVSTILLRWHAEETYAPDSLMKTFWRPVAASPKPVLICLGKPLLYQPSLSLFRRYSKDHPGDFEASIERRNRILPLAPNDTIQWGDIEPVKNSGPATGGVLAAINLSAFFGQQGKQFGVRFGDEASFADLRESPAVIVGALNNRWTMQMTSGLHFVFEEWDGILRIHENQGSGRNWTVESGSHGQWTRDYGLVTREPIAKTGQFVVKVAGISDNGTEAASEVVTRPEDLANALKTVPPGWDKKNLQIVIATDITEGKAGPPQPVAFYVW